MQVLTRCDAPWNQKCWYAAGNSTQGLPALVACWAIGSHTCAADLAAAWASKIYGKVYYTMIYYDTLWYTAVQVLKSLQAEMCAGSKMRFTSLSPIVSPVQSAALLQTAQVRTTGGLLLACTLTFLVEHITCWAIHVLLVCTLSGRKS